MSESYRVFIGDWRTDAKPGWTDVDVRGLSWEAAKGQLAGHLKDFENDTCDYCRSQAEEELVRLQSASPGAFEAEVDGVDYVIIGESEGATS